MVEIKKILHIEMACCYKEERIAIVDRQLAGQATSCATVGFAFTSPVSENRVEDVTDW